MGASSRIHESALRDIALIARGMKIVGPRDGDADTILRITESALDVKPRCTRCRKPCVKVCPEAFGVPCSPPDDWEPLSTWTDWFVTLPQEVQAAIVREKAREAQRRSAEYDEKVQVTRDPV